MSLKPPKHSEQKWPKKRGGRKRSLHLDYNLIVCEGSKTEPNYFLSLKDHINRKESNRIQLEIKGGLGNTIGLFECAHQIVSESVNGYSNVWLVYDKDDFPADHFNEVEERCRNCSESDGVTYHAIWSNQCIELWFLLHFMYLQADLHRNEYFPRLTERLGIHGAYAKNREDIFEILLPYLDNAIRNAMRLEEENQGKTPTESAPGTKMHIMMQEFKQYL